MNLKEKHFEIINTIICTLTNGEQQINKKVVSISIFVPILCFPFAYKVGIGIGTIKVTANTQKVLAVPTQTKKKRYDSTYQAGSPVVKNLSPS